MKDRNEGIDLLRIISMLMVTLLHVIGQGGFMIRNSAHPEPYYVCWLIETAAFCAVNCYGLISGYVGVKGHARISRLLELYLTALFYTLGITLLTGLLRPEWIGRDVLLKSFFPVQWKTYWYFSAYVVVFLLSPYMNRLVLSLSQKECRRLMLVLFLVFSAGTCIAKAFDVDFLELVGGYSLIWLLVLYLFGACLRLSGLPRFRKRTLLIVYLICVFVSWISKILIENATRARYGKAMHGRILTTYTAPTIFLCGICLLLLFEQLRIRTKLLSALIKVFAPLSFSVYLIHAHPVIWDHILKNAFRSFADMSAALVWIPVLLAAAGILLVCLGIDYCRNRLFAVLRVRRKLDALFTGKEAD